MYSERLKNIRLEKELRQKDVANVIGINEITYTHYESEYYIFPINHLSKVCDFFDVSLDYIFGFCDNKQYKDVSDEIDKIKVGKRLKEFRKNNKLTQVKLASILNTVQPVITNYENGKFLISTPFLYTICKTYNVSADYLLGKIN